MWAPTRWVPNFLECHSIQPATYAILFNWRSVRYWRLDKKFCWGYIHGRGCLHPPWVSGTSQSLNPLDPLILSAELRRGLWATSPLHAKFLRLKALILTWRCCSQTYIRRVSEYLSEGEENLTKRDSKAYLSKSVNNSTFQYGRLGAAPSLFPLGKIK